MLTYSLWTCLDHCLDLHIQFCRWISLGQLQSPEEKTEQDKLSHEHVFWNAICKTSKKHLYFHGFVAYWSRKRIKATMEHTNPKYPASISCSWLPLINKESTDFCLAGSLPLTWAPLPIQFSILSWGTIGALWEGWNGWR